MSSSIDVRELGVEFGVTRALTDVSWSVHPTGVHGLIGANGAGKTTLVRTILGLTTPTAGEVRCGVDAVDMAYCPDVPQFEKWMTAAEVVDQSAVLGGRSRPTPGEIGEALAMTGIDGAAGRRTGTFSRGMRQRLGIAAALIRNPRILILDEPTSALDPEGRADVLALIEKLGAGCGVVFSSHILTDVEAVASHLLVLDRGRAVYSGPTTDFLAEFSGPETLRLVARSSLLDRLRAVVTEPVTGTGDHVTVTVAPESIPDVLRLVADRLDEIVECTVRRSSLADAYRRSCR